MMPLVYKCEECGIRKYLLMWVEGSSMVCDLSASQSKRRLNQFSTAKLIFLGVAAHLWCCFYTEGNFLRDCTRERSLGDTGQLVGW